MAGAVPDVAFQAERGLSYRSFASELMHRVSETLQLDTHGTRVGNQTSLGVASLQQDIDTNTNSNTGRHVLNMRFALGADDTTYLNSAIAMLFTGTEMDNRQLDLSGLSPPDVQKHIRKAVIAQLQSERRKRRTDAVRVIAGLADQIVSYLSFPRVREMVYQALILLFPDVAPPAAAGPQPAADSDAGIVNTLLDTSPDWDASSAKGALQKYAGKRGVYCVLLLLEAALDRSGSIGTAISAVIEDMVGFDPDDAYEDDAAATDDRNHRNGSGGGDGGGGGGGGGGGDPEDGMSQGQRLLNRYRQSGAQEVQAARRTIEIRIQRLRGRVIVLVDRGQAAQQALVPLNAQIASLGEELKNAMDEVDGLRGEQITFVKQLQEIAHALLLDQDIYQDHVAIMKQITATMDAIGYLADREVLLIRQLDIAGKALDAARAEAAAAREQGAAVVERAAAEAERDAAVVERQQAEADRDAAGRRVAALEADISALEQERDQIQQLLEQCLEEKPQLEASTQTTLREKDLELQEARRQIDAIRQQVRALQVTRNENEDADEALEVALLNEIEVLKQLIDASERRSQEQQTLTQGQQEALDVTEDLLNWLREFKSLMNFFQQTTVGQRTKAGRVQRAILQQMRASTDERIRAIANNEDANIPAQPLHSVPQRAGNVPAGQSETPDADNSGFLAAASSVLQSIKGLAGSVAANVFTTTEQDSDGDEEIPFVGAQVPTGATMMPNNLLARNLNAAPGPRGMHHGIIPAPVNTGLPEFFGMLSLVSTRMTRNGRLPAGQIGPYTLYCIRRGLTGLRAPLHDVVQAADLKDNGRQDGARLLEVDQNLTYQPPPAAMTRLVGPSDPTDPRNDIAKTYRRSKRQFKSIVHSSALAAFEGYAQEAVAELRGDYAIVPKNPSNEGLEARFALRWKPVGEVGEQISKAVAMEHAALRCQTMFHDKVYRRDLRLAAMYALMSAGFELRRVAPHAKVVQQKRRSGNDPIQHSRLVLGQLPASPPTWEPADASGFCTTPHAQYGKFDFAVPYDAGYSQIPVGQNPISDIQAQYNPPPQPAAFATWEDYTAVFPNNVLNRTFVETSAVMSNHLQDAAYSDDIATPLPDYFIGPDVTDGAPDFPVFEYRSLLRDVSLADQGHANLVPTRNVAQHIEQLRRPRMHAIVRYALLHSHSLHEEVCQDEVGDATAQATLLAASTTQQDDRSGIWNDMLREIAISNDRLYTFIRTLSGAMGEDASVLLSSVDETAQRAARALETERKEIAKRVSDFQSKIVEIIIGGIVKTSHLEMRPDGSDGEFQVVDSEMAKDLRALASGESGRPFFEANVAVQGMINQARTDKASLSAVVRGLGGVVSTLYEQLQTELSTATGVGSGGLAMLAQPRNSFMVHLRDDATAAIRVAYDRFSREFNGRSIRLYELVEGSDPHLSLRFAEFVAHVLIQVRSSSGPTALYVSEGTRQQTALQARASLLRLINRASEYTQFAATPSFHGITPNAPTAAAIQTARIAYFGNTVTGHGGSSRKGYIIRVEGRSDTQGGWQGGYSLPYSSGLRYHPYANSQMAP